MNRKEKSILILIDAFTQGGAQKVLLRLVPEWIALGYKVSLLLVQNSDKELHIDDEIMTSIDLVRINASSITDLYAYIKVFKYLVNLKPQIIQCHLYWAQILGGILKVFAVNSQLVWVEHNTYINRTKFQWLLYRLLSRLTNEIIAVSKEVEVFLRQRMISRIRFIPNPVSNTFRLVNTNERNNSFIFIGRLNEQKNPKLCLDAFNYGLKNHIIPTDSTLKIVGDGPYLSELQKLVCTYKLDENIEFLGFLSEFELAHILNASKTLVSSSKYEGFALVRVEALATGCTIVTTRTAGINGILTEASDSEVLINGIWLVEDDPESMALAMGSSIQNSYWTIDGLLERSNSAAKFNPAKVAITYLVNLTNNERKD